MLAVCNKVTSEIRAMFVGCMSFAAGIYMVFDGAFISASAMLGDGEVRSMLKSHESLNGLEIVIGFVAAVSGFF